MPSPSPDSPAPSPAERAAAALAGWRARFAELDRLVVAPLVPVSAARQRLRLRLARRRPQWEIGPTPPVIPSGEATATATPAENDADHDRGFMQAPHDRIRVLLEQPGEAALALDGASQALLMALREHARRTGHVALGLHDGGDRAFIGRLLADPVTRPLVVTDDERSIRDDARPITWKITDQEDNPERVRISLVFGDDESPAPSPLVHLPGAPARYLHHDQLFTGVPPLVEKDSADYAGGAFELPRAALTTPEAARFALHARLKLPADLAAQFRAEPLRPRLRARLVPRDPGQRLDDDLLIIELAAIAPEGAARAIYTPGGWRSDRPGVETAASDALIVHDFAGLEASVTHVGSLATLAWDADRPAGGDFVGEPGAPSFAERFATWLAAAPAETVIELAPELAAFAAPPIEGYYDLDLAPLEDGSGIDWFDVRVRLRASDTTLTPAELALLARAPGRWVHLPGRGWRRMTFEASAEATDRLTRLGLDPASADPARAREAQRFHALQLPEDVLRAGLPAETWERVRRRVAELHTAPAPDLPAGLTAELRPYQREGFHFLVHLAAQSFGGVLADDMGLGKTVQALTWLLWLAQAQPPERPFRALIVAPKSVVPGWQLEAARFTPALTTGRLDPDTTPPVPTGVALVVVNYTQLRLHSRLLTPQTWDAVVLDEGQNIKNPSSSTAHAACALRARHRLVLTGTPIENRLLDLWSLFAFAQPGLLGSQTAFKRLYPTKDETGSSRHRLGARVRHFMLRRTKAQVAQDLPPRIEEDILCELEGPQRALYDAELKRARQLLMGVGTGRDFDSQRFNILQSLLRLRQICCDPRLVGFEEGGAPAVPARPPRRAAAAAAELAADDVDRPPRATPSAKLDALLDTLEPLVAEGHRVLVFSQFVTMLELIRTELTARTIGHLVITGQTENRQALVDEFQSAAGPPVFLLSLKAAGTGLNLTAASYVVLYDPWWNPAVEAQAIDRTHRIGQTSQVIAYRLIARDTIEEKIRALQREKAALAAAVVQEESLATVLDLESLRRILE